MELSVYFGIIRRWLWLIIIAVAIGTGASFITSSTRPPVYEAVTKLVVGQFIQSPNPNLADLMTGQNLATTYVQLLNTRDILQGAIDQVGISMSPDQLSGMISTRIVTDTAFIVLTVRNSDPVMAADLANALAQQLVDNSPTSLTRDQQSQVDFMNSQIDILTVQVNELQQRLSEINRQLDGTLTPEQSAQLADERDTALTQLNQSQSTIAQFANAIATIQQRVNSIQVVETADVPTGSIATSRIASTLAGTAIGGVLAFGIALFFEYLNDTIRSNEAVTGQLLLPVLGSIGRFGSKNQSYKDMLLTNYPPTALITEGYRAVRANTLFTVEKDTKALFVVTSASPQEGKTVTTSNLAISMAMSDLNVLLIDADLRRPKVHEAFGLDNKIGLTTLLYAKPVRKEDSGESTEFSSLPEAFRTCVQPTGVAKLSVLTSGFIPSNPTEILISAAMAKWIKVIYESPEIDAILIDSPPGLAVTDAAVLASNIGAKALIVVDWGTTRLGAAKRLKEQFEQLQVPIIGVIMNRVARTAGDNSYYYGYYSSDNLEPEPRGLRRLIPSRLSPRRRMRQ